ncbi:MULTISPECIES: hypothetical protein [unclassified Acinetobacter]|nr:MULTISPECIES: hypothetical protein [unclassified Acinetobacter]
MNKFVLIVLVASTVSACAFNPTQYDEMRHLENLHHDKMNG